MQNIAVSPAFRKRATNAVLSIVLFIIVYVILFLGAVALTIACGYAGIVVLSAGFSFLSIALGLGLIALGLMVLIFLIKFIFASTQTEEGVRFEITREQEPKIFALVDDIVAQVETKAPKKIFLVPDVNAFVSYDSNFWSMILPVRKNLSIGLGLINALTVQEFKAILAHEFGHFSQRSMKVGAYVYNVNKVIHNMLFDNQSYSNLASGIAKIHSIIAIFTILATKIVQGIQWILRKVYNVVNISYMSLSREMEFHADAIAVNYAGSNALAKSLLRLQLADNSYSSVINYYNGKISSNTKPEDFYPAYRYALQFIGERNGLEKENGLPQVSVAETKRFDKSKLVISNQWASHPATKDRVAAIDKLNITVPNPDANPATDLFVNLPQWQKEMTTNMFAVVQYRDTPQMQSYTAFKSDYTKHYLDTTFDLFYNNYYDNKNPLPIKEEDKLTKKPVIESNILFGQEAIDLVYTAQSLEGDINFLNAIADKKTKIKTFDYDGKRYKAKDSRAIAEQLKIELEACQKEIYANDVNIYWRYKTLAQQNQQLAIFEQLTADFEKMDAQYESLFQKAETVQQHLGFVSEELSYEVIERYMSALKEKEDDFKNSLKQLLEDDIYNRSFEDDDKAAFDKYLSQDWIYFSRPAYNNDALQILYAALGSYRYVVHKSYFKAKKELLDFQVSLEKGIGYN